MLPSVWMFTLCGLDGEQYLEHLAKTLCSNIFIGVTPQKTQSSPNLSLLPTRRSSSLVLQDLPCARLVTRFPPQL